MKCIKNVFIRIKLKHVNIVVVVTILIVITCIISIYIQKKEKTNIKINDKEFKNEKGKVCVYLSGAVNNIGVYSFNEGIILEEALNIIGGIRAEADMSKVNLSKVLYNSEKIVIPYIQEEKTEINKDEEVNKDNEIINNETQKININSASQTELMTLTGIGEVTAKNIIEYRKNGNFELIEDIKKVSGIGDSKFDKIKDKISVE